MILHPNVLAVLLSSGLIAAMVAVAGFHAVRILDRWDLESGSEEQLRLERTTYLVSTLLAYAMAFELASFFLFIYSSDALSGAIVGAMCAAGTLNATAAGFPALALKAATFVLAGVWLVVNAADNRGPDYPLIRFKYGLLLAMVPLVLAGTALLWLHFLGIRPDVITSCCGSLFSVAEKGVSPDLRALPPRTAMILFYGLSAVTLAAGGAFIGAGRFGIPFAVLSAAWATVAALSLVAFVGPYVYELPTHRCPFCILKGEYGYVGYPLYLSLLGGAVGGTGVGILAPFRRKASIAGIVPAMQRRLALAAVIAFLLFAAVASWPVLFSSFTTK